MLVFDIILLSFAPFSVPQRQARPKTTISCFIPSKLAICVLFIACVQPPLSSKKSERRSFPIFLRTGAAVHRLVVYDSE